jgi:DNA invertase Pin-like site-specific DNA recombinase
MSEPISAVTYWRMSSSPQEKSIPPQRAEMLPKCKLADVEIVKEFEDRAKSGGGMKKCDDFLDMLHFCQERHAAGQSIGAVVCYNPSRFSRADSNETAAYIWEFRKVGVNLLFTWERWFDFRKEDDRTVFNIQQDFTNNRFLRDLSAGVLRGKKTVAVAGFFTGGMVPYGFDRVLLDEHGVEITPATIW